MEAIVSVADIGALIRKERKEAGLTQSELAQLCGVGLSFITNIERGKESAEVGKVLHVLRMLGLDLLAHKRGE